MEPLMIGALLAAIAGLAALVTERIRLLERNRQLAALLSAGLDIGDVKPLDDVLQQVVDLATELLGTRWCALAVQRTDDGGIAAFVTAGLSPAERQVIGSPPSGRGLLGVKLAAGEALRVSDIGADHRSAGFPPNHPPMVSVLAVPIICRTAFRGILYVTEARRRTFSQADEELLFKFARQAAIAIDNATLQERVGHLATIAERLRIGRELHDDVAQVLAACNAQLLAIREHLAAGRGEAADAIAERLARMTRDVYADSREQILALRSAGSLDRPFPVVLEEWSQRWSEQCAICLETEITADLELGPDAELQLLRIAQESLSNVRKHSSSRTARLALVAAPAAVELVIEDDGAGFPETPTARPGGPRFGLATMRERADAIGATLAFERAASGGARIRVTVPKPETTS